MSAGPETGCATAIAAGGDPVAWHDAENGGFGADLRLFERLASESAGPVVDLGAGTGRVALPLAAAGNRVVAVDTEPVLLDALAERARERDLAVTTLVADVRSLRLPEPSPLIVAPMQLLHILGGEAGRRRALSAIAANLAPGGRFCAVVLEEPLPIGSGVPEPVPDVRDAGGWVHSSLPTEIVIDEEAITMHRVRQLVAPDGTLTEAPHTIRLDRFDLADLDRDAEAARLWIVGAERLPSTVEYEDSVAVFMETRDV